MSQLTLAQRGELARIARQKVASGVTVTYTPASGASPFTLTVVPGKTVFSSRESPAVVEISERDYIIAVADLAAAGVSTPALGDQVTETMQSGVTQTFEIQTPGESAPNEPAFRYSCQSRMAWRIHTKAFVNGGT